MRIKLLKEFNFGVLDIVDFIAKEKPIAAKKFKKDLLHNLEKDLKNPFHFKKSIYIDDKNLTDYVFEEYVLVYERVMEQQIVSVSDL
jgi:plasmid stabilization system protein ParE